MSKIAKRLKTLNMLSGASQALYQLTEPLGGHEFVVVSGVNSGWAHEVMAFAADGPNAEGPSDWLDISCVRGTTDHAVLFEQEGYIIEEG
jgi:hypothetical protein